MQVTSCWEWGSQSPIYLQRQIHFLMRLSYRLTNLVVVKALKASSIQYLSPLVQLELLNFLEDIYWFGGREKVGCAH